jgi:hypothetical protein
MPLQAARTRIHRTAVRRRSLAGPLFSVWNGFANGESAGRVEDRQTATKRMFAGSFQQEQARFSSWRGVRAGNPAPLLTHNGGGRAGGHRLGTRRMPGARGAGAGGRRVRGVTLRMGSSASQRSGGVMSLVSGESDIISAARPGPGRRKQGESQEAQREPQPRPHRPSGKSHGKQGKPRMRCLTKLLGPASSPAETQQKPPS